MMDDSETYVKMCEKAKEIQEVWKPEICDRVATKIQLVPNPEYMPFIIGFNLRAVLLSMGATIQIEVLKELCIWLPRQDQLQKMVELSLLNLLVSFYKFVELKKAPSYAAGFTSMEQLWLAFVMKEKYGKVWDSENWVKEKV